MPTNVAIAPARRPHLATAASTDSGASESRKSPPDTGGITATSSPAASDSLRSAYARLTRVQQTPRLVAEPERGQTSPTVAPSRELDLDAPGPARSRSAANSLTRPAREERIRRLPRRP